MFRLMELAKVDKNVRLLRKAENTAQKLESHYAFLQKTDAVTPTIEMRYKRVQDQIGTFRLDDNTILSHPPPEPAILKRSLKEIMEYVFPDAWAPTTAQLEASEKAVVDMMQNRTRSARAGVLTKMLELQIAESAHNGWFMLFNTLTVAPEHYHTVFSPESTAFKDYVRHIDKLFARAAYGSFKKAKGEDYHQYFAVTEEGGKHGRLHIHVLHCFKELPNYPDPNAGRIAPRYRELQQFKQCWPYGFSTPIMVRYSLNDAYGRKGFKWPLDHKTGKPLQAKGPLVVAGYMAKYISKGYVSPKRSLYQWRVKKSQAFGLSLIKTTMNKFTTETLLQIAQNPLLRFDLNSRTLPPSLIRVQALKILQNRQLSTSMYELAQSVTPRPSLLQQLRGSSGKKETHSSQSSMYTEIGMLTVEDLSKNAQAEIDFHFSALANTYFPETTHDGQRPSESNNY